MKRKVIILGIFVVSMLINVSCNKDFLNTQPLDKISSNATWADGALSEAFIYSVYSYLYYGGFHEEMLASLSDEAMFTHGRDFYKTTQGTETPSSMGWFNDTFRWNNMYLAIRQANTAIQELPESTFDDDDLRQKLLGEAHFLRAYYYHQLMRHWGGVPLISTPYGLDEDYNIARSSYADGVDFVLSDLDMAEQMLPDANQPGRASKISAMGLKARVLLYAASDLHDAGKAASILSGYSNPELLAYPAGGQDARWEQTKNAAKAVLDLNPGWKMNLTEPVTPQEGFDNYVSLYCGGQSAVGDPGAAVELIFQRTESSKYAVETSWPLGGLNHGINNGPNGYHNWAGNTPIQQLVDDYEMMDGSQFDWTNPAHKASPYENRDPRFKATVLYDGADWKPRPSDVASFDPANQIQTGYYDDGAGGVLNGIDTRDAPLESWNGSRSHYYARKFIDPDPAKPDNGSNTQVIPWPIIRTTEIAFIYAEACIETGDEDEARLWINKIRYRAGMPGIDDAGDDLKNRLINERRIELVLEEHRYFDCARWMIAPTTTGSGIKTIIPKATLKAGATAHDPYRYDPTVYDYTYDVVSNTETETRTWKDKMYYRPISRDEMNRNELLVNNPGYSEE